MSNVPTFNPNDPDVTVAFSLCLEVESMLDGGFDDPETEPLIRRRLVVGDTLAWCELKVEVTWRGFHSAVYLGGCTFAAGAPNTEVISFANDHDMLGEAICDLASQISAAGWEAQFPDIEKSARLSNAQPVVKP